MLDSQLPQSPQSPTYRTRPEGDGDLARLFLDRVDGYRRRYDPSPTNSAPPTLPPARLTPATSPPPGSSPTKTSPAASTRSTPVTRQDDDDSQSDELVLLVHGTFAGSEHDEGVAWWQKGSPAWNSLRERLPDGVAMPQRGEIFHWSGENSERARIKAGQDLLDKLLELEASGRHYHLIGHSHGGSVIWHALRLATLHRESLPGLRTWTTVGTPFLHYRTHGALSIVNILNLVLGLALLKPAYSAFCGFFHFAWAAIQGRDAAISLRSDHDVGMFMALLRSPFLKLLEVAGVPVVKTADGLKLGSFDPASGHHLFDYLFCSWEGWVVILVTLFGGYVFLFLASLFLNPALESLRIRAEKRLERTAMETYRGRWLGLWSPEDEAINGLRATLDLSVSFVANIAPRDRILLSDYVALISRPYLWLLAPAFNNLVRPMIDRAVRTMVVKTAQGNNRPAAEVVAVSPYPTADSPPGSHPALPPAVATRLLEGANEHARDIAPGIRQLLAAPSFVSGLERFGQSLSGGELIHTSYFGDPAVLDLLALHVAWGRRDSSVVRDIEVTDESLWAWFCAFKHSVHETVKFESARSAIPRPHFPLVRSRAA